MSEQSIGIFTQHLKAVLAAKATQLLGKQADARELTQTWLMNELLISAGDATGDSDGRPPSIRRSGHQDSHSADII